MLTFKYTARDAKSGQTIKAEVQAENEQAAAKLIRQQGLSPTDIKLMGNSSGPLGALRNKVKTKDRILFSRQLATLINAGLPLVQSLRNVANQTESKPLKVVVGKIISDIEGGSAFSAALARHPKVFNQIYVNLVGAGEASGTLDAALERLATQQEKDAEVLSKVRGAMIYPAIVIVVMIIVMSFMIVKVLPQVEVLYKGIPGATLPLITRILLSISHAIIKYWWAVIILVVGSFFLASRFARTLTGRRIADKAKMRSWPIGGLFMKLYMARFSRTGTTLIASGVPLLQMLDITAEAINNVHIEASIRQAIEKVKGGKSLSDSIQGDPNFLVLVPDMLKIGEQSGSMEQMLEKTADYYEKQVDNEIKTVSTIIEPVLMVILGLVAFTIVAAVLLPIYGLANQSFIH
ncbi:MAG: type II secretion system F family protein [Candidatus Saccharimonadales bacterium]